MESTKSGFLQKAGKHTFQAWRKRWFVLKNDNLKYYNPAAEYTDSNLLGAVQMVEIQSVKPSKEKKHCFVINTRSRTYHMSAKSDMERDDWVICIRNSSTNQRRVNVDVNSTNIYAEIGSCNNENNLSQGIYAQVQLDPKACSSVKNDVALYDTVGNVSVYDVIGSSSPATSAPATKSRAHSLIPLEDKHTIIKPRSHSEEIVKLPESNSKGNPRIHTLLHDMSINEDPPKSEIESIYNQIDAALDGAYDDDDDDDDEEDEEEEEEEEEEEKVEVCVQLDLPTPRNGNETYAFDEIRKLVEKSGDNMEIEDDFFELAKSYNLTFDGKAEYPAIMLLSSYLNGEF